MPTPDIGVRAFPILHTIDGNWVKEPLDECSGMMLRDYFAAKAMQSLAMHEEYPPDRAAAYAYKYADAMMKAREA